jgi:hypothetical protein
MEFTSKVRPWVFCSEEEGRSRERMLDVHVLEATDETKALAPSRRLIDPLRAVRKFIRSGGDNLHNRLPPRSIEALRSTARYLSQLWIQSREASRTSKEGESAGVHYAFIMDRINAIRQELVGRQPTMEIMRLLLHISRLYIYMEMCCQESLAVGHECGWFDPHMHTSSEVSCITAALGAVACVHGSVEEVKDELASYQITLLALSAHRRAMENVLNEGTSGLHSMLDSRIRFPWLQGRQGAVVPGGEATALAHRFLSEVLVQCNPHKGLKCSEQQGTPVGIGLAALFALFLPDLAVWRLLLIESTANKREGLQVGDIARRCGLSSSSGVRCMAEVLSALGCSTCDGSGAVAVYAMRDPGRAFSSEAVRTARSVFSRYFAEERRSLRDRCATDLWREALVGL